MATEDVKKLIKSEIEPYQARIIELEKTVKDLETSYWFLANKYDKLLEQMKTTSEKSRKLENKTNDLKINMSQTESSIDDLAQYLRRDCVEINTGAHATICRYNLRWCSMCDGQRNRRVWSAGCRLDAGCRLSAGWLQVGSKMQVGWIWLACDQVNVDIQWSKPREYWLEFM